MGARRRQSSAKAVRARTQDSSSIELDQADRRVLLLETTVRNLERSLDVLLKRVTALQAQLDHVTAKIRSA